MVTFTNKSGLTLRNRTFTETVKFTHCFNIRVINCSFTRASLYFVECQTVGVLNCDFINANTRHSLQCDKSSDIYIAYNYFSEPLGDSAVDDIINLYKSTGATVEHNYLIGGGPSTTGGGILLGDNMGDNQTASHNICINCGQYGIAIAGGTNNRIKDNIIVGDIHPWSNVGIYVWGIPQRESTVKDAEVSYNHVSWFNKAGKFNPFWRGSNVTNLQMTHNSFVKAMTVPEKDPGIGRSPMA